MADEKQFGKCDVQVGWVRRFRTEASFCWVMHGQPNTVRIHYCLLPFRPGRGRRVYVTMRELGNQTGVP